MASLDVADGRINPSGLEHSDGPHNATYCCKDANNIAACSPVARKQPRNMQLYRCFTKSFTTLEAYINSYRGRVQCFELS
jgi:hypothetical protein